MKKITALLLTLCFAVVPSLFFVRCGNPVETGDSTNGNTTGDSEESKEEVEDIGANNIKDETDSVNKNETISTRPDNNENKDGDSLFNLYINNIDSGISVYYDKESDYVRLPILTLSKAFGSEIQEDGESYVISYREKACVLYQNRSLLQMKKMALPQDHNLLDRDSSPSFLIEHSSSHTGYTHSQYQARESTDERCLGDDCPYRHTQYLAWSDDECFADCCTLESFLTNMFSLTYLLICPENEAIYLETSSLNYTHGEPIDIYLLGEKIDTKAITNTECFSGKFFEIPFLEILKIMGGSAVWEDEKTVNISLGGNDYILYTDKGELISDAYFNEITGEYSNLFLLDFEPNYFDIRDGECFIDHMMLEAFLINTRTASLRFDYNNRCIIIDHPATSSN